MRRVLNTRSLNGVFVAAVPGARLVAAEADIRALLQDRHQRPTGRAEYDFEVQDTTRYLAMQTRATESIEQLTLGLGAVAMLMGGAGILALTLLSVKERTPEIGLRVAVGATRRDVFVQFLVEAILLALGGWALGSAAAALLIGAIAAATSWPVAVPLVTAGASLAMAMLAGISAGALPASRASRIPPIEALLAR